MVMADTVEVWITAREACSLLSVSDEYIAMASRAGLIEKRRLLNASTGRLSRNVRYRQSDVLNLLKSQR